MPLRNQPYLPLYVQDYLTDERLNNCLPASQGVYIKIMCILHKQSEYGCILLKQKDKQTDKQILNFAYKFAKLLPFDKDVIFAALQDLLEEEVLIIEGDKLYQKRMVKDNAISEARSKAGKSGGGNPNLFKQIDKQTLKQITENENENTNENTNDIKGGAGGKLIMDYNEIEFELSNSDQWLDDTARAQGTDRAGVKTWLRKFIQLQRSEKPGKRSLDDFRKHFSRWMRIEFPKAGNITVKPQARKLTAAEQAERDRQDYEAGERERMRIEQLAVKINKI